MVLLGGLEIVAAGYIIHKHQQNKRDKQRLEEEAAALEEEQYRIFPPESRPSRSEHRRRRSHSRRRHSYDRDDRRNRPHSYDGKYRRESPSPRPKPILKPTNYSNPQFAPQQRPPPYNAAVATPPSMVGAQHPPQQAAPVSQPQPQAQSYPQDVKYGWTDDQSAQRPPQAGNFPPTGWPAEWQQSQGASSSSHTPQAQRPRAERSRGRSGGRPEDSPRVRFAAPRRSPSVRSLSRSPPPSYRV